MFLKEVVKMRQKKIRYGIPQTTDGRVIRWFVDER